MDILKYYIDLFSRVPRQHPGSTIFTKLAFNSLNLKETNIDILDIGCGTGCHTMDLVEIPGVDIYAVDNNSKFLNILKNKVNKSEFARKIKVLIGDIYELPLKYYQFDLVWVEGTVNKNGFEIGINEWKKFVKPGGNIVISELTYTNTNIPLEVKNYWIKQYPSICAFDDMKIIIENSGCILEKTLILDETCWINNYYIPLINEIPKFLSDNNDHEYAFMVANEITKEYELYQKYKDYFNYFFYILKLKQ